MVESLRKILAVTFELSESIEAKGESYSGPPNITNQLKSNTVETSAVVREDTRNELISIHVAYKL